MLTHPTLDRLPRIAHAFFTRQGGTSEGIYASLNCGPGSADVPERVVENRRRAVARLGLDPGGRASTPLATAHQVHGKSIQIVTQTWETGGAPKADGLVTNVPGLAIGILTADCAPVLLADTGQGVIGAAHAGWQGAKAGVLEAVLAKMIELGAKRTSIHAVIGPCIGQPSYEVGPEFQAPFLAETPDNARFFRPGAADRFQFDLGAYVQARLGAAGIAQPARIAADTYGDPARFFSYRRATHGGEPDYGRTLSAIAIRKDA